MPVAKPTPVQQQYWDDKLKTYRLGEGRGTNYDHLNHGANHQHKATVACFSYNKEAPITTTPSRYNQTNVDSDLWDVFDELTTGRVNGVRTYDPSTKRSEHAMWCGPYRDKPGHEWFDFDKHPSFRGTVVPDSIRRQDNVTTDRDCGTEFVFVKPGKRPAAIALRVSELPPIEVGTSE